MDASKKQFTYIKNSEALRGQEDLTAKVAPDNSRKYSYSISKVGASAESAGKAKFQIGETELAKAGYEASVSGAVSVSHTKERKVGSSPENSRKYSYSISKVGASAESVGKAKFLIGETEVAKAGYEASVSGAASVSHTKERKVESSPDNSRKYSHSISKVGASAESAGKAKFQIGETEVAKAGYEASVSGAVSVSHTKEKKVESSSDNSRKYSYSISKVGASAESAGKAKFQIGETEVGKAGYEASVSGATSVSDAKEKKECHTPKRHPYESSEERTYRLRRYCFDKDLQRSIDKYPKRNLSSMDASKKSFTYIKNGKVLRDQEGLTAKVEHEADELFKEIIGEIGLDAENKPDKPAVTKNDDEITQLLMEICNAFRKGPLSSKPKEELYSGNSCSSGISKVHSLTESVRETKCHIGKTEVAGAEYEASVSVAASVSHAKEKKEELAPENSRKYSYSISKIGASAESAGRAKFQIGETEVAKVGYEASVSGAASVSHTKERKVESSPDNSLKYSYSISKVGASAESAGRAKFQIGETEVAKVGYEASVSGAASVSHTKERKVESSPDNSRKYSHSISKVGASAESAGKAKFQIGETEVAKAGYEASVSGAASVSHTKEKKVESSDNSYKYNSTTSKVEASGELKGESQGQVTAGRGKNKVGANYSGRLSLQGNTGASFTKMQMEWLAKNGEREGSVKVAEAKVESQAKAEMHGKVEIGGSKKSGIEVELQAKATSYAEVVGLHGKADFAVRKKEKMGFHVAGAEITCGKGQVGTSAEFKFKSDKFGEKKGEAKAKFKAEGVRARALGVDVQAEEECMKAEADLGIRMAELNAGNAKVVGRKKGIDVEAEAKVRGIKLNALNAEVTGIDNSTKTKVETEAGMFANFGNIQVTGMGSTGTHCKGDISAGVSVGNVAVGISRQTEIKTPNHQLAYGNVNLLLGPPSLPSFNAGGKFNIGIPFFSAGGISGGGGGNDGTNGKQIDSRNVAGEQSGEASGCGYKSAIGEYNTTAQGESVNNSGGHTDPSAGMDHDASQKGYYGNCDYGSRSGLHTGPQTVTDEQSEGVYGYRYGTASDEGVYNGAAHGSAYTVDISAGNDHDASQKCDYANSEYVSRSGSYAGPHNVTDEQSGGLYGYRYGGASDERVYIGTAQQECVVEHWAGHTADICAGMDHDASQEGDYLNGHYSSRSEWQTGTQNVTDKQAGGVYGHRYGSARDEGVYSEAGQKGSVVELRSDHTTAANRGIDYDASQNGTYGNSSYEIRSESHAGAHPGAVYGYRYGSANDGAEYSEVTQQENVICGASYNIAADGGICHDASQKGSSESHRCMGGEGVYTQIAQVENFTQSKAGRTAADNGRGVDRDASQQPGNNGSFLHGNDTEMNGEDRGNTAGYGLASKNYAMDSEVGGLSGVQIVDGCSTTHSGDIQTQATGYGDNENCGVNNASTDHRSTHTYMELLMVSANEKMAKKFGESTAPRQRRNEAKSSRRADSIDKEHIKKYLKTTYIPESYSGSGKTNQRPTTEEADRAMYSPEDEKHSKPRKKVPPKKPFGEKKNIHTIFTLSEGDTRPIKRIKDNVVCFADE